MYVVLVVPALYIVSVRIADVIPAIGCRCAEIKSKRGRLTRTGTKADNTHLRYDLKAGFLYFLHRQGSRQL